MTVETAGWGPDGALAVVRRAGNEARLEYPIGRLIARITDAAIYGIRVSPRGDRIAFHVELGTVVGAELRISDLQGATS